MNIAKNMEAIFIIATVLIAGTSLATAAVPAHHAASHAVAKVDNAPMQVVTISAKRLTAEQKAALGN
ncbi:hypothetical protein H3H36_24540 [Duganella sp. FT3S]|uniref:Uncharacterized protein n=1 Tax=Rugamonas fusca TaxID=2758568 RepID=A0A7W2EM92_9BURK|nr:hypothetical protein [Rugamonas fusca]MBA5608519.1 hypothetical protein [Rugamonas fusca]